MKGYSALEDDDWALKVAYELLAAIDANLKLLLLADAKAKASLWSAVEFNITL